MVKMDTTTVTWYEENEMVEYWETEDPSSRVYALCPLAHAIRIAQVNRILLAIQPVEQDGCIFADFTE